MMRKALLVSVLAALLLLGAARVLALSPFGGTAPPTERAEGPPSPTEEPEGQRPELDQGTGIPEVERKVCLVLRKRCLPTPPAIICVPDVPCRRRPPLPCPPGALCPLGGPARGAARVLGPHP
ncbi:MAG: hypothetical protein ABR529_01950 [Actinomycetota bacterium]